MYKPTTMNWPEKVIDIYIVIPQYLLAILILDIPKGVIAPTTQMKVYI